MPTISHWNSIRMLVKDSYETRGTLVNKEESGDSREVPGKFPGTTTEVQRHEEIDEPTIWRDHSQTHPSTK